MTRPGRAAEEGGRREKEGRKRKREEKWKRGKKKKRKEREKEREGGGIRGDTGARSATSGAWARVSATRGSREKQGAGYECRVRSFGDPKIGTGRFPESWG